MREFIDAHNDLGVYEKSMAERVCVIEVGAENNPASPLYAKSLELGEEEPILSKKDLVYGSYHININKSYYEQNKQEVESSIIEVLKTTNEEFICLVPSELLTDKVIETIKNNDNIKRIAFWGTFKINKELISREIINSISLCGYLDLIGLIENKETIRIRNSMPQEELNKLKQLFEKYPAKRVIVSGTAISQINELMSVIKADKIIINDANMYNAEQQEYFSTGAAVDKIDRQMRYWQKRYANYRQTIKNIEKCYATIIEKYDNVEFASNDYGVTVGSINIKIKNKIYDSIISEVTKMNFTPLEAYLYFYNMVKLFKEYKEEAVFENDEVSRKSEFILFNEYIVCAGYTGILTELVDRYGDPNLMVSEYLCYLGNEEGFHSRSIVEIKDKKYKVFGMYISDITADRIRGKKDLFMDRVDHFLMTKQEIDKIDGRTRDSIPDCTDVLFYNQNGSNVSAKDFPSYAWDDAHYIFWKFYDMSQGRSIRSFYISDPFEIRQTEVPKETIIRALRRIHTKTFTRKYKIRFIERIRWINHILMFNRKLRLKLYPATYGYMVGEEKISSKNK